MVWSMAAVLFLSCFEYCLQHRVHVRRGGLSWTAKRKTFSIKGKAIKVMEIKSRHCDDDDKYCDVMEERIEK